MILDLILLAVQALSSNKGENLPIIVLDEEQAVFLEIPYVVKIG
jgi:hypothetical protein